MSDTEDVPIADGDHHEQGEEGAGDDVSKQEDEAGEDSAQPGAKRRRATKIEAARNKPKNCH